MLELGGVVVSVLDRSGREDVRLHQPRCANVPLSVYEDTWTTLSPLVAMHHHDLACAWEFFLKLLRNPTVASEPRFYMLMLYARVEHK